MDTSATLLGLGLLMAFITPIGYLIIDQSRREKARKKILFNTASDFDLQLSKLLILRSLSLGLDQEQRKLLVIDPANKNKPQVIDLPECKIHLVKKYLNNNPTGSVDDLTEISLQFHCSKMEKKISFFQKDVDPVTETADRLQKALEWEKFLVHVK
ncbi:hypothetical protein SAMN04488034_101360 [Salinimicrobium catena]|uniref:Uncharacterized protein n=1 Tax=Salinimicrobium catena TaxID=390640 RepID=A0A1H5I8R6_9FLAO|nr:hypothetical protein [Salinimicrobium catena]SDK75695.1 hypothetical protein SAMN04488140_101360 [Salinimicrobium catena]SEE36555.1 hypothetical protein SAMN04488034_101360 [Salinimicrobium catena]